MKPGFGKTLAAGVAGVLFGAGLAISGMTNPKKVIGFLDLFGNWDASLMLVMAGAIAVHFVAYRVIKGKSAPAFGDKFAIPTRRDIDLKLVAGAAVFGLGWGLGGFCPGPGLVSSMSGASSALVFVVAMLGSMFATSKVDAYFGKLRERKVAKSVAGAARETA